MELFFQILVSAISISMIYILFALGLTLLLGVFNTFNFAHGELVMLACFITYFAVSRWELPYGFAFVFALPLVSLIAIAFDKAIFYPMRNRPPIDPALATFGAIGILQTAALVLWGGMAKGIPSVITGKLNIGGVVFPLEKLPIIGGSLIMVFLLMAFVQRTKLGLGIRAVQQDPDAATMQGINVKNIRILAWVIAGALAATAGVLLAPTVSIEPTMGSGWILKGFAVVILGGLGSITGAIISGFALGFIDAFGMAYLGTYSYMFTFIIIVLVLLVRPQGLMRGRL